MTTSARQDLRAGCLSIANTVQSANPTLISKVYDYPPESFATPCIYVEKAVNERIEHDASLRRRQLTVNIVILNKLMSNDQATGEQDVLVDLLLDALTAGYHAASGSTVLQPVSVTDTEVSGGDGVKYAAAVIAVELSIQEGRF